MQSNLKNTYSQKTDADCDEVVRSYTYRNSDNMCMKLSSISLTDVHNQTPMHAAFTRIKLS